MLRFFLVCMSFPGFMNARTRGPGGTDAVASIRNHGLGRNATPTGLDAMTKCPRGTGAVASIPQNGLRGRNATTRRMNAIPRSLRRTDAMESLVPTCTLAAMVPVIKILVIMLAGLVSAPIGILALKILPVMRMSLIPLMPPRFIPGNGSDNIGGWISVIRGPSMLRPEKIIQHPF
jgi:hypothetical protein